MYEFYYRTAEKYNILLDDAICAYLAANAVVASGVSGGKDSDTLALKLWRFLDEIGHTGKRVLIHSDLGDIEHADSLPQCRRLSEKTGMPLIIVKPPRPMIERLFKRWDDIVNRYCQLSIVKLCSPFPSESMRYCTSELKVAPIISELSRRFDGQMIINAVGIRGEESTKRAKKPISKFNKKLTAVTKGRHGIDWNPIRDVMIEDVVLTHINECFCRSETYDRNGNTRVSCCVCVLATVNEIKASMRDERNHPQYRRMVELDIKSTYSFSQNFWLGDVCPELLSPETLERLAEAKEKAELRRLIEAEIPKDLLYVKADWPQFQPSMEQCALIAGVRERIGILMDLSVRCITAQAVYDRYAELLKLKEIKLSKKKRS